MKRPGFLWHSAGFAASTLGGTMLHFLLDWTGRSLLVAPFSGVNESTWEHMKLLFWPMFLFAIFQWFFFRGYKGFWWGKLIGTGTGLLLIPVLFYTYNGALGKSPDWVNIVIFYLASAGAYGLEWLLFRRDALPRRAPMLALASICLLGALFVIFTFSPPKIPLFLDPLTGTYGYHAKNPTAFAVGFSHIIHQNAGRSRIYGTVPPQRCPG